MGLCIIVGAGDLSASDLPKKDNGDLLIAADGGMKHLCLYGIEPDLFVGDLDSEQNAPRRVPSSVLPHIKDDTDMIAAVKHGLSAGYREFLLLGALGGKRFSHTVANIQTLSFLKKQGANGIIRHENTAVRILSAGETLLLSEKKGFFSLFALTESAKLSIHGAMYSSDNLLLSRAFPLGVSNEFSAGETEIAVKSGEALLIIETEE